MLEQNSFDLHRGDVLPTTDDYILESVADFDVAIGMDHCGISGMHPAAVEGFRRSLWILEVAVHNDIASSHDLAQSLPVVGHLASRGVHDTQLSRGNQLDPLAGFD